MFLPGWLLLLTLIPAIFGANPGVEVKLTEKGIEYGEQGCSRGFVPPTCGSAAVRYQAFSLSRETAGSGCDTGKTQDHPSSGLFRQTESFSDWKSRIQAFKVRRPVQKIQRWKCCFPRQTWMLFLVFRSWTSGCRSPQWSWSLEAE